VVVDLQVETQNTGGAGIDTLRDIENVQATHYGDSLTGNGAANELRGEGGNDWIWGNGGNDIVNGGSGDDAIAGGTGMDQMIGGSGNDHIWGGSNADTFVFASGWGDDWIWDFQAGSDLIDLTAVGGLNNLIQLDIEDTENGVSIGYDGQSILLVGVLASALGDADFLI
jgi:serralysin